MEKEINLHLHSQLSDGEYSAKEIIKIASASGIQILSITDHNCILNNISSIKKIAKKLKVDLIEGIEISTFDRDFQLSLHILGYSTKFNQSSLKHGLEATIKGYNFRAKKIILKLNKEFPDLDLSFERMQQVSSSAYISRNYIAGEIVCRLSGKITFQQAVKLAYIHEDKKWMMTPKEAIKLISESRGISVLAHPAKLIKENSNFNFMLKQLAGFGLTGIEVCSDTEHSAEFRDIKNLADKFDLAITAGSDWHGRIYSNKELFGLTMTSDELRPFFLSLKSE